jgi:ABC-type oligopeptide transport system substrate-binding subunit
VVLYRYNSTANQLQAEVVRRGLVQLGFKPENIEMKRYYCEIGGCGFPGDLAVNWGWCADYPDPYAFLIPFFDTYPDIHPAIDSSKYLRRINAAKKLVGNARLRALGKLDIEMMDNLAPIAPMRTYNNRYFFSNRVNPRSLVYQGVYSDWSIPALALKAPTWRRRP